MVSRYRALRDKYILQFVRLLKRSRFPLKSIQWSWWPELNKAFQRSLINFYSQGSEKEFQDNFYKDRSILIESSLSLGKHSVSDHPAFCLSEVVMLWAIKIRFKYTLLNNNTCQQNHLLKQHLLHNDQGNQSVSVSTVIKSDLLNMALITLIKRNICCQSSGKDGSGSTNTQLPFPPLPPELADMAKKYSNRRKARINSIN